MAPPELRIAVLQTAFYDIDDAIGAADHVKVLVRGRTCSRAVVVDEVQEVIDSPECCVYVSLAVWCQGRTRLPKRNLNISVGDHAVSVVPSEPGGSDHGIGTCGDLVTDRNSHEPAKSHDGQHVGSIVGNARESEKQIVPPRILNEMEKAWRRAVERGDACFIVTEEREQFVPFE